MQRGFVLLLETFTYAVVLATRARLERKIRRFAR
jgi:hypothetical protein